MLRGALIGAGSLMLIGIAAPAQAVPAAATAPTAPYTALVLDGQLGYSTILTGAATLDPSNATLSGTPSTGGAFTLNTAKGAQSLQVTVAPPTGSAWATATAYQIAPAADATHAAFAIASSVGSCSTQSGSMTVEEAATDASTALTAFAATFTIDCNNHSAALSGEIRWNSSIGYTADEMGSPAVAFLKQPIGVTSAPQTVTFTATGSDPVTFADASLTGINPAAFAISANTCSGATLTYGQTCTVSLTTTPKTVGGQSAYLSLRDNTAAGQKYVVMTVSGYVGATGTYYPLSPARILDTRSGLGAPKGAVGAGGTIHLQVLGQGGVPSAGVSAVVLNVTVTGPSTASYLTVYPDGATRPTASSLNFPAGWTGANSVTATVGANGKVALYNAAGNTQIIADVLGYYGGSDVLITNGYGVGGQFHAVNPIRLLDTRTLGSGAKLPANSYINIPVDFGTDANPHIKALVVNVTAVQADANGYLTAWDGLESDLPATSTLNYTAGAIVPNLAVVPAAPCSGCGTGADGLPSIGVYTSTSTHVLVDIVAVYDDGALANGLRYNPITPTRIVDSRTGLGTSGALGAGSTAVVTAPGSVLAVPDTWALAMNVTAISPSLNTFLTVWPDGDTLPPVSNLNPQQGQTIPNAVDTLLSIDNKFDIYNARGTVNVVVDVDGTFYLYPGTATSAATPLSTTAAAHARTLHPSGRTATVHQAG